MTAPLGVHENVHEGLYRGWDAVSNSALGALAKSPAHYRAWLSRPDEDTPYFALGRAVHAAILEPARFSAEYLRAIDGDGRTKEVKDARARQLLEHPTATVISSSDYGQALAMRESVMAHPEARRLLEACGRSELSLVWDDTGGLRCKARLDRMVDEMHTIVDLKTTQDASPEAFARSAVNFGYARQSAHYTDGALICGLVAARYKIIAVEKTPPYAVAVYEISGEWLRDSFSEVRRLLDLMQQCRDLGEWPGYGDEVITLERPAWARRVAA